MMAGFAFAVFELAQVTDPDYLDEAGRIIGSPSAGPKPENPGDRGGYAQLLTLFMLFLAVGFIAWRIQRSSALARASRSR